MDNITVYKEYINYADILQVILEICLLKLICWNFYCKWLTFVRNDKKTTKLFLKHGYIDSFLGNMSVKIWVVVFFETRCNNVFRCHLPHLGLRSVRINLIYFHARHCMRQSTLAFVFMFIFVLYGLHFCWRCAFIVLGLVFSVLCLVTGWEEHLQNDLFCAICDAKA